MSLVSLGYEVAIGFDKGFDYVIDKFKGLLHD